jgi:hypothetical protein
VNPVKAFALIAIGLAIAVVAAFVTRAVSVSAPLFAQPAAVPSVGESTPSPQWAAAVDRARPMVRASIVEQNLPGVSIAVGVGADIVWAEGFGWRDVVTKAPVTPKTRFNIGSAASALDSAPFASLGMTDTGTDSAAEWSPGHIGEPEEDFPGFTFIHDVILRPIGIADPAKPLPGDRATFYVPATRWRATHRSPPGTTADVHARSGVLRGWESVLFHAVRSRPLRAGDESGQR